MFCPFCIEKINIDINEYKQHINLCSYIFNKQVKYKMLVEYTFGKETTIKTDVTDNSFNTIIDEFYSENQHKGSTYIFPIYWKCKWEEEKINNPKFYIASNDEVKLIKKTINNNSFNVVRVERCENKILYIKYLQRRNKILDESGSNNEKYFFHGSAPVNYNMITTEGFDIGYAKNGTYGFGIYFSTMLSYSNGYTIKTNYEYNSVLCCRITIGNYTTGKYSMTKCPNDIHSTTDYSGNMCIVFNDFQSYPEYIVYYNK